MKPQTFTLVCELKGGEKRLVHTAPVRYLKFIELLGIGEEVQARLSEPFRAQGTQSMRYYRGIVVPDIALACGYDDPDEFGEVHNSLAWKFLRLPDHPQLGYPRRKSTSKREMSQQEITAYIDQCILWAEANITGCRVRRPDECDLEHVYAPDYDKEAA